MRFVAFALLLPFALYVFYLAYVTLRVARDNGKLAKAPCIVQAHAWAILVLAVVLDVIFNVAFGSLIFFELPHSKRLAFTARCKSHLAADNWRGRVRVDVR